MIYILLVLQIFITRLCAQQNEDVTTGLVTMDKWVPKNGWSLINPSTKYIYWLYCPACEKEVCKPNTDILWTNFINAFGATTLELKIRFTIKDCTCKNASLSVYYLESNGHDIVNEKYVDENELVEDIIFPNIKYSVQESSKTISITKKGIYFALKSNGGCVTILDFKVDSVYCEVVDILPTKLDDSDETLFLDDSCHYPNRPLTYASWNQNVIEGTTVTIFCSVPLNKASTSVNIIWSYYNDLLNLINDPRYKIVSSVKDTSSFLIIKEVKISDSGIYECKVTNENVTYFSKKIPLNVKHQTSIINAPQNMEVVAGDVVTINCSASVDNLVKFMWFKDNVPIPFENRYKFLKFSLTIKEATIKDSGNYTCMVESDVDWVQASAKIIVQDMPNAPEIVDVECIKENRWETAVLKWKPMGDNGVLILNYTIQYTTTSTPDVWKNVTVPSTVHYYPVRIMPWWNFTFRVIARNKIGESGYSNFSHVCSLTDVPHKNPGNVTVKYVEPNILLITWTPLPEIDHNADDLYYIIYWKANDSQYWNYTNIWDWQRNKFMIELANVTSSDGYKLKLVAANREGEANITAEEIFVEIILDNFTKSLDEFTESSDEYTESKLGWFLGAGVFIIFCFLLAMAFYICKKRKAEKKEIDKIDAFRKREKNFFAWQ